MGSDQSRRDFVGSAPGFQSGASAAKDRQSQPETIGAFVGILIFVLKRLLITIPVLIGMSMLVFSLIHLVPGDPAQVMLGLTATPENIATIHRQLRLDDPLWK